MAGRKEVWNKIKDKMGYVTELREKHYTYKQIAQALNICEKTFYKYLENKEELKEAIELGDKFIDQEVKNKLIDLCLGGIKKEKKILITEGMKNGKPIVKGQRVEVEETLPSINAIKYYLDKRDGSYNTFNNNNKEESEIVIKGGKKEKETLSIRLQNIVKGMDNATKEGTSDS